MERFDMSGVAKLGGQLRIIRMARCVYFGDRTKEGFKIESLMNKAKQAKIKAVRSNIKVFEIIECSSQKNDMSKDEIFEKAFQFFLEVFEHEKRSAKYHLDIGKLEGKNSNQGGNIT